MRRVTNIVDRERGEHNFMLSNRRIKKKRVALESTFMKTAILETNACVVDVNNKKVE